MILPQFMGTKNREILHHAGSEYPYLLGYVSKDIDAKIQTPHARVTLGPTYHTSTTQGDLLRIHTLSIETKDPNDILHRQRVSYYLIALSETGEIVGHRYGSFPKDSLVLRLARGEKNSEIFKSVIATAQRKKGLAIPIDLVHMDYLQRQADVQGVEITWRIDNANKRTLERIREIYGETPTEEESAHLQELEQEQQRWQRVWGENGLLGIQNGEKTFYPASRRKSAMKPDNIILTRREIGNTVVGEATEQPIKKSAEEKISELTALLVRIHATSR